MHKQKQIFPHCKLEKIKLHVLTQVTNTKNTKTSEHAT